MEVILDTNFIISCVKRKIDFIGRLREEGFKVLIPKEVIDELKDLRFNVRREEKTAIELALQILDSNEEIRKMKLGNKKVDESLIEMGKKGAYIATLDRTIKRSIPNRVIISDAKNDILVERD
ncbi:MAG: PIN domain-containing protein [archaeon]|nr:PIN domain-containing protein [archaeon]